MNNDIKDFYLNISRSGMPTYDQVMSASPEWIESTHNWCQRAFPNFEPSELVIGSPVLDDETLEFLKTTCKLKIYDLTMKYLNHYNNIYFVEQFGHNNRRVTRLIKFLSMLEYDEAKNLVFGFCYNVLWYKHNTGDELNFWDAATYWDDALIYKREK